MSDKPRDDEADIMKACALLIGCVRRNERQNHALAMRVTALEIQQEKREDYEREQREAAG